jgi:hypothetical protein
MDSVLDAVSVGINPIQFRYSKDGVMEIQSADWFELSVWSLMGPCREP